MFMAWLAPRVDTHARELRILCGLLFLAGVSRVIAVLDAGWPAPGLILSMAAELTVPAILLGWHARINAK